MAFRSTASRSTRASGPDERGRRPSARRVDYSAWSFEELRRFALQLQIRDAHRKTRRELIELFAR